MPHHVVPAIAASFGVIFPRPFALDNHDAQLRHVHTGRVDKVMRHRIAVQRVVAGPGVVEDDAIVGQVARMETEMVRFGTQQAGAGPRKGPVTANVTGNQAGGRRTGNAAGRFFAHGKRQGTQSGAAAAAATTSAPGPVQVRGHAFAPAVRARPGKRTQLHFGNGNSAGLHQLGNHGALHILHVAGKQDAPVHGRFIVEHLVMILQAKRDAHELYHVRAIGQERIVCSGRGQRLVVKGRRDNAQLRVKLCQAIDKGVHHFDARDGPTFDQRCHSQNGHIVEIGRVRVAGRVGQLEDHVFGHVRRGRKLEHITLFQMRSMEYTMRKSTPDK
jgi:hypothetical protein